MFIMAHLENSIPQLELCGAGSRLLFSHANGYPPEVYSQLLEPLTEHFSVTASIHRPLWAKSFREMPSWRTLSEDLLQLLGNDDREIIGVGHSMGAAALVMAAMCQPELFSHLVLVEPVMVSRRSSWLLRTLKPLARRRLPMVTRTLARVDRWPSQQAVFEHFRPKSVFSRLSDSALWDYVNYGTVATEQGEYRLRYDKYWEAHCYLLLSSLWHLLPRLSMPVLIIRGEHSHTVSDNAWQRLQAELPHFDCIEIAQTGHLLPFEQPDQVVASLRSWIQR